MQPNQKNTVIAQLAGAVGYTDCTPQQVSWIWH